MIQVYADDLLAYDSRMETHDLVGLTINNGLNRGGTAEIIMPLQHPAYFYFVSHRTIVRIYRDGLLRFRGRALYPAENFVGQRTITCEGELCLLRDGISRPYLYQDTPAAIFASVLEIYNSQVEDFKQFRLGEVTVTDPNDYVRLESEKAETVLDTVNKLIERCGGYIVFTDAEDGARVINWYAALNRKSGQEIEFGENLLSFASTGANTTGLATGLVPYGAKDKETGKRLTLESVNDGKDYLIAEDARAVRGTIMTTATWDDVTEPVNLLRKAQEYLTRCKVFITSLELSALDLSYLDKTLDGFSVGDLIRVKSAPHGVDEDFQLTQMTEDLLNPALSSITLGKSIQSLTGSDVAGDSKGMSAIEATHAEIVADYNRNIQQVAADIEYEVYSQFEQDLESIVLELSKNFVTSDNLTSLERTLTGKIEATSNSVLLTVSETYTTKNEHQNLSSQVATFAGSISLAVTGALGSKATIALSAGGKTYSEELDLSKVRQSFANDTSEVVISGGKVIFNSGTLIINSNNLQVDETGTITATNAVLSGTMTAEGDTFTSVLASGWLRFYYGETICGGIAAGHYGSSANKGIALRLEHEAKYLGFSKDYDEDGTYELWYCINFGANPSGYTNQHIFFGSVRFTESVYFDNDIGVALSNAAKDVTAKVLYMSTFDNVVLGDLGFETHIRGSRLNLGLNEYETHIYGLSGVAFHARAYMGPYNVDFDNNVGVRIATKAGSLYYVLRVDDSDNCHVGNDYTKLRLRGSSVVLHSSGAAVTSDRRKKNSIEELPEAYLEALDNLTPVRFRFNEGTSGRYHVGFIAQDVEQALKGAGLSSQDFGGFVDLNGDGTELGLIYTEFVGLLHQKLRKLEARIKELEEAKA